MSFQQNMLQSAGHAPIADFPSTVWSTQLQLELGNVQQSGLS